jgi:hypothetical protein
MHLGNDLQLRRLATLSIISDKDVILAHTAFLTNCFNELSGANRFF